MTQTELEKIDNDTGKDKLRHIPKNDRYTLCGQYRPWNGVRRPGRKLYQRNTCIVCDDIWVGLSVPEKLEIIRRYRIN